MEHIIEFFCYYFLYNKESFFSLFFLNKEALIRFQGATRYSYKINSSKPFLIFHDKFFNIFGYKENIK